MRRTQKITITLDIDTLKQFKEICKKEDIKVSTKINSLIRNWLSRRGY
ncbi:MAG: hypothetical protein RE471_06165 [Ferroplasma sp.]|nr:hypothetical protein [Ferroplasma sp.]WMT50565.1 MAG: hypothetical protein RE471_06165 [Ferroplasma sp.]